MKATVNGIRLAYSERGREHANTLLLVHGFPVDRHLWDAQLAGLSSQVHVVAPDLRGAGASAVPPGPYTVDQYAADLVALLDHLAIRKTVLAGLSMGGYIALAFWRRYPERVQALILCDTRAEPDSEQGRANRDAAIKKVQQEGVEALADEQMRLLLAPASQADTRLAGRARAMMVAQPAPGVVAALGALRERPDSQPTLPTIAVPTLVLVGAEDKVTPPEQARAMRDAIPAARLAIIPGAGHFSPLERPRGVNRALVRFLSDL